MVISRQERSMSDCSQQSHCAAQRHLLAEQCFGVGIQLGESSRQDFRSVSKVTRSKAKTSRPGPKLPRSGAERERTTAEKDDCDIAGDPLVDHCQGCLPRLTEYVTNFSLALGGLIGGNQRVGVVYHCRLNLLVRWQSSSLSSR